MYPAPAVRPVERLVDGFLIGEVDLRTHRPRDPAKRRPTALANFAVVKSLGKKVRDEAAKRLAFLLLAAFEIPQNRRVDVDRRSGHDELMITLRASDVNAVTELFGELSPGIFCIFQGELSSTQRPSQPGGPTAGVS
jgi:hypothetical protein